MRSLRTAWSRGSAPCGSTQQSTASSLVVQHTLPPLSFWSQAKLLETVELKLAKHGPLLYQNASIAAGTSEWQQGRVAEKERYTEGEWPGVGSS